MKVSDLIGKGIGIDLRKVRMVHKATVAAGRVPTLRLGVVGIEIGQEQSTGDTSRTEIPMPKYQANNKDYK